MIITLTKTSEKAAESDIWKKMYSWGRRAAAADISQFNFTSSEHAQK